MREITIALTLSAVLFLVGAGAFYVSLDSWEFNFNRVELNVNGMDVVERLRYIPDKPYHTLYRNFVDELYLEEKGFDNYIVVNEVICEEGRAYVKDYFGMCKYFDGEDGSCLAYTERNEYGCAFGNIYGFTEGGEYWIQGEYRLHPKVIFLIDGDYYVKFVVYSAGNHKFLGENFVTEGDLVRKEKYYPDEDVIIYIRYDEDVDGFIVNEERDFEFDGSLMWLRFIVAILPAFLFFGTWYKFGRESAQTDLPEEMSSYPRERKAWQVAAYFNPPFLTVGQNLISAMLVQFYHKKVIDVLAGKKKEVYVKLNAANNLDKVEKKFYDILAYLYEEAKEKNRKGKYFNLQKTAQQFMTGYKLRKMFVELGEEVRKEGKNYIHAPMHLWSIFILFLIYAAYAAYDFSFVTLAPFVCFCVFYIFTALGSSLFMKFKGDNYMEYQHWRAFRRWLKGSFAMKYEGTQAVKLWDHYLVYATALGVSENVIKELKARHLISDGDYNLYSGINYSAVAFATSGGAGGAGSGGVGGGGVGGGGGGGR